MKNKINLSSNSKRREAIQKLLKEDFKKLRYSRYAHHLGFALCTINTHSAQ